MNITPQIEMGPGGCSHQTLPTFQAISREFDSTDPGAKRVRSRCQSLRLTPRQHRTLEALLTRPLTSAELRRIAGAANVSALMTSLRVTWGVEFECVRFTMLDRDGHQCRPGEYSLTENGRATARRLLGSSYG